MTKLTKLTSLVAVWQHVPRVFLAFSSIGPFLTSLILIAAVFAKPASFGTVRNHVMRVVVAFSSICPLLTSIVMVEAVLSSATAAAAAAGGFGRFRSVGRPGAAAVATSGTAAVAEIARDEGVSQNTTIVGASPRTVNTRARFLGARRWAFAFALMVDVAGFLASLILLAVRIAFVHNVDDFGVGEVQSRVRPVTDAALVVLITGYDGEPAVGGERFPAIVHDGAVIVRHSKVESPSFYVKVVSVGTRYVFEENLEGGVTVCATLLVMETDGVTEFVSHNPVISAAADSQRNFVIAMEPTNVGVAAAFVDHGNVVAVTGGPCQ